RTVDERDPIVVVVTPPNPCAAMCTPPDAVDLVDEEDAWRIGYGLREGGRHLSQHLAEIARLEPGSDGGGEELQLQRVGQRPCECGLVRAWRTGKEQPRAHLRPGEAAFSPELEVGLQRTRPFPGCAIAGELLHQERRLSGSE